MLGHLLLQLWGETNYLVGTLEGLNTFQAVTRTVYDVVDSAQKLLLLPGKDIPPDDVVRLALFLLDAVIGAFQVVQREHAVFRLDVLEYFLPVAVVVQFCRDNIV